MIKDDDVDDDVDDADDDVDDADADADYDDHHLLLGVFPKHPRADVSAL